MAASVQVVTYNTSSAIYCIRLKINNRRLFFLLRYNDVMISFVVVIKVI